MLGSFLGQKGCIRGMKNPYFVVMNYYYVTCKAMGVVLSLQHQSSTFCRVVWKLAQLWDADLWDSIKGLCPFIKLT